MKNVGLLTLFGYYNYGNRLQNLAMQEVLNSLGYEVETLVVKEKYAKKEMCEYIEKFMKLLKSRPTDAYIIIYNKLRKKRYSKLMDKKESKFKDFTMKNIKVKFLDNSEMLSQSSFIESYDYFVIGSDQVWHPLINQNRSIYFLPFVPKNKKIPFSPSFGVTEIPDICRVNYKQWISSFEYLSVREYQGAKIIKELTDRDAVVLVDPTMLLSKEKWRSFSKTPINLNLNNEKYLLTYFLGRVTKEYVRSIKKVAKDNKLRIINLNNIKEFETYQSDPGEFIEYINSASILCTDSFHGIVFSILMETPFIVFNRKGFGDNTEKMFSRIDTLLDKFEFQPRKFELLDLENQVFDINFLHVPAILDIERRKAFDYLKISLNID